jgi:hypothetical protein
VENRYGTHFGGGFVYGPQPGMTFGDTIGRYTYPSSCDHISPRSLTGAYPAPSPKAAKLSK